MLVLIMNLGFCRQCLPDSLSPEKAKGKIVMCLRGNGTRVGKGGEVKRVGGVGFILGNSKANGAEIASDAHLLPATAVDYQTAQQILKYIESSKEPKAYIFHAHTVMHTKPAPAMAAFTSRGPSTVAPEILKVTERVQELKNLVDLVLALCSDDIVVCSRI